MIVMHALNLSWVPLLIISVMELVRQPTMLAMQFSHMFFRHVNTLSRLEIIFHVLSIDILVDVRIFWHAARLINDLLLILETFWGPLDHLLRFELPSFSLGIRARSDRFYGRTQHFRISVAILERLLFLLHTLIGFLGRVRLLRLIHFG